MAQKKRDKWFFRWLMMRLFARLISSAWSKARHAEAERNWVKFAQHMNQIDRLREIGAALAKLEEVTGAEDIEPYLPRLEALLHEPFAIEDIPALCEESRAMLFPFEAFYERNLGERFIGGPARFKVTS